MDRNSSEEKEAVCLVFVFRVCTDVYESTMSRQSEGYYWLVLSKSKQFLNNYNGYNGRRRESQMPFNKLLFFLTKKAVSVAKVVTQMKKLKERRVQRPVSAAEIQKKKALLEQVSLSNHHHSNILLKHLS